jgi:hypothetical protein
MRMLGVGKVDKQLLSASFSPGNQDIICHIAGDTRARCKPIIASLLASSLRRSRYLIFNCCCYRFLRTVDNKRFKKHCIEGYLGTYLMANSRSTKSAVITDIVSAIRASSKHAGDVGFVRFDPFLKRWYEVADRVARDKVGHSLRDATKARKMRQTEDDHPKRRTPIPVITTSMYFPESQFELSAKKCLSHPIESTTADLCDWFEAEMG